MESTSYKVLGVMSGTSRDGVDLAHLHFKLSQGKWQFTILETATLPYSKEWEERLGSADQLQAEQVKELDIAYTKVLADKINLFIKDRNIVDLDAVCSHGHTVFHQPEKGYTLQIGNLPELADWIQQTVVCNFRVEDVQLGGQGAPLVPIGDRLLFGEYAACINLGGFANTSFEKEGLRIAYDLCPANIVLNRYAEKLGFVYDDGGNLARKGKINEELLQKLNALPYYQMEPPKSLGIEWVRQHILPLLEASGSSSLDILATFTQHIGEQMARSLAHLSGEKVLITGGGAYHSFLIEKLRNLSDCEIILPSKELIEYKEALIFGLLGVLKIRADINVLRSVTGASKDHSAGFIYYPTKS